MPSSSFRTTHSQLNRDQQAAGGISPGLVRLSVGIETIDDIVADVEQALFLPEQEVDI
jgi:O-acetylhomoserine (thiol)-lyase